MWPPLRGSEQPETAAKRFSFSTAIRSWRFRFSVLFKTVLLGVQAKYPIPTRVTSNDRRRKQPYLLIVHDRRLPPGEQKSLTSECFADRTLDLLCQNHGAARQCNALILRRALDTHPSVPESHSFGPTALDAPLDGPKPYTVGQQCSVPSCPQRADWQDYLR